MSKKQVEQERPEIKMCESTEITSSLNLSIKKPSAALKLLKFIITNKENEMKPQRLMVSPSTTGSALLAHVLKNYPRKNNKEALFVWILYKQNTYPIQRDISAQYLYDQYATNGVVTITVMPEHAYGAVIDRTFSEI